MIIKTQLSEEEIEAIRKQYKTFKNIFDDFPNYVNRQGVEDNLRLLIELFGEEIFQ